MNQHPDYEHLTWIGTILGAHGLNGLLRVRPFTNTPEYYLKVDSFVLEKGSTLKQYNVDKMSLSSNVWRIQFLGIDDRYKAMELKGFRLLLADTDLKPLDQNEVFIHQIIGCKVLNQDGVDKGKVTEAMETGANLVFKVQFRAIEYLVPFSPDIVLDLNVEDRKLVIHPVPGLMDDSVGI